MRRDRPSPDTSSGSRATSSCSGSDRSTTPLTDSGDEDVSEVASGALTALDDLTRAETIAAVRAAVQSLPPVYREAVVLCDLQDMDYAAAAGVMQCPIGTSDRGCRARAPCSSQNWAPCIRQQTRGGNDVKESEGRPSLHAALRAMAEDEARLGASAGIEARLLAEVPEHCRGPSPPNGDGGVRRRCRRAVCAVVGSRRFLPRRSSHARVAEVTTEFMPLAYSSVPSTNLQIVRLAVPRAALVSFGLTPPEPLDRTSTDTVLADVLVGDDGLARAVRFVRPAADQEQMP